MTAAWQLASGLVPMSDPQDSPAYLGPWIHAENLDLSDKETVNNPDALALRDSQQFNCKTFFSDAGLQIGRTHV